MTSRAQPPLYRWRRFQPLDQDIMWIQSDAITTGRSRYGEQMRLSVRGQKGQVPWEARICLNEDINPPWLGGPHRRLGNTDLRGFANWTYRPELPRCLVNQEAAHVFAQALVIGERRGMMSLRIQLPGAAPGSGNLAMSDYTGHWNIKGIGAAIARLEQFWQGAAIP